MTSLSAEVADVTGFPEMLDGRVKTLHPKVHGGLLGVRGNPHHERDMADNGIGLIDMTVLNLYPFEATVKSGASFDQCIENVDIGGPSMLRSAAKNHSAVTVLCDPADYAVVLREMDANDGATPLALRIEAAKALLLAPGMQQSASGIIRLAQLNERTNRIEQAESLLVRARAALTVAGRQEQAQGHRDDHRDQ